VRDAAAADVVHLGEALLGDDAVLDALRELVGPAGRPVDSHEAKALMRSLLALDIDVATLTLDPALAAYLLDPSESRYLVSDLL